MQSKFSTSGSAQGKQYYSSSVSSSVAEVKACADAAAELLRRRSAFYEVVRNHKSRSEVLHLEQLVPELLSSQLRGAAADLASNGEGIADAASEVVGGVISANSLEARCAKLAARWGSSVDGVRIVLSAVEAAAANTSGAGIGLVGRGAGGTGKRRLSPPSKSLDRVRGSGGGSAKRRKTAPSSHGAASESVAPGS